jgi:hypothetical protein
MPIMKYIIIISIVLILFILPRKLISFLFTLAAQGANHLLDFYKKEYGAAAAYSLIAFSVLGGVMTWTGSNPITLALWSKDMVLAFSDDLQSLMQGKAPLADPPPLNPQKPSGPTNPSARSAPPVQPVQPDIRKWAEPQPQGPGQTPKRGELYAQRGAQALPAPAPAKPQKRCTSFAATTYCED